MQAKIRLNIVALSHSVTQNQNYAVVLGEEDGRRRLPIVIGGAEAQAIAIAMEHMAPTRPLTHDLFKNTLDTFHIKLKEIIINNLLEGIFYAQLICEFNGKEVEIDSRTSDAIALAVRFHCPIFTYEFILEKAGVVFEEEMNKPTRTRRSNPKKRFEKKSKSFKDMSIKELEELLDKVLMNENYEKAADIRDEINRRKEQG